MWVSECVSESRRPSEFIFTRRCMSAISICVCLSLASHPPSHPNPPQYSFTPFHPPLPHPFRPFPHHTLPPLSRPPSLSLPPSHLPYPIQLRNIPIQPTLSQSGGGEHVSLTLGFPIEERGKGREGKGREGEIPWLGWLGWLVWLEPTVQHRFMYVLRPVGWISVDTTAATAIQWSTVSTTV